MTLVADRIANLALAGRLTATRFGAWQNFLRAAAAPRRAQGDVLRRILWKNAKTEFGRAHMFTDISGPDQYRRAVPVQTFDTLQHYIGVQNTKGITSLTAAPPVFYQRSSGTLDTPKDVPLTQAGIARIRRQQRMAAYAQHRSTGLFAGKVLGIGSPAIEGQTTGGAPFGSASGLIYASQPRLIRSKFVLPSAVFDIADYDARYYTIAALGLAEPRVTGLATANPSTLVKLLEVINQNAAPLLCDVSDGRLSIDAPHDTVTAGIRAAPERARALSKTMERAGRLTYGDIWPGLAGVVTWMGGSCSVPLALLRPQLPDATKIVEAGYVSSEFRGTINVDVARNLCLPTLTDNYFEFVERDAWERGEDKFLGLDELETGASYYPIVTTPDGLYRYNINDIVTVTGRVGATPTLAFVQKGKGVTSITGEKLTEAQLLKAVDDVVRALALQASFFVALADEDRATYVLYLEATGDAATADDTFASAVDARLIELNTEYAEKRASGRLQALQACRLRHGSGDAYRRHCVANGQREAQFKVRHLQYAREVSFAFDAYLAESERT